MGGVTQSAFSSGGCWDALDIIEHRPLNLHPPPPHHPPVSFHKVSVSVCLQKSMSNLQVDVKPVSSPPPPGSYFLRRVEPLGAPTGDWHLNEWNYTSQQSHINGM